MPVAFEPMSLGDLITHLIILEGSTACAAKGYPVVLGPDDQPLRQIIVKDGMIYLSEDASPHA
jgi:hypothetical protein